MSPALKLNGSFKVNMVRVLNLLIGIELGTRDQWGMSLPKLTSLVSGLYACWEDNCIGKQQVQTLYAGSVRLFWDLIKGTLYRPTKEWDLLLRTRSH